MKVRTLQFALFLSLILALEGKASAQQQCEWRPEGPLGPTWYQPGGWGACSPSQKAPGPQVRWESRWGAIAVNDHNGDVGTITGQATLREAKRIALQRCGSKGCEIKMEYHDQCAAIAWGTRSYDASGAATIEEASKRAMRSCGEGADDCKVILTECSLPIRVQ